MSIIRHAATAVILSLALLPARASISVAGTDLTAEAQPADTLAAPMPAPVAADSIDTDSCRQCEGASSTRWIKQLTENNFRINDPAICYPAFPKFCLAVYNWGDRTFNSYDTDYVIGTGKNWKLQGKSFNWLESLTMLFPDNKISMHTHLYADAGAYISFMAVSLGYMFNVNELMGIPTHRSTFNFDFTCSRFAINLLSQRCTGDMTITRLGQYNDGHSVHLPFNGADVKSLYIDAYYFFNHRRYSHAAAYSFSKYQLKSAGTWIAGFSYSTKSIDLDFSDIDVDVKDTTLLMRPYFFHYKDYQLLGGYGYNWAINAPRWVLNATGLLSMGYRRSYEDASDGDKDMLANGIRVNLAATYNHRALYASLNAIFRGSFFYTSQFLFFNNNLSFSVNVGMRF